MRHRGKCGLNRRSASRNKRISPCIIPKCGTAFIDAGFLNGTDSIRFARCCDVDYSEIFAFAQDKYTFIRCVEQHKNTGIRNIHLLSAALGSFAGEDTFYPAANGGNYLKIEDSGNYAFQRPEVTAITVRVAPLDEIVNHPVGMIKMDTEGAEYEAPMGARRMITNDKPFLAFSGYLRLS